MWFIWIQIVDNENRHYAFSFGLYNTFIDSMIYNKILVEAEGLKYFIMIVMTIVYVGINVQEFTFSI